VYLLDLDMRNPSVCSYVGVQPPRPLADYFLTDIDPGEVLFATDIENLVIAGNLRPIPGASELLASGRLDELLTHIRRRSPTALIIIDLPPVMSTDETLVVAPRADAIFLVVSEGKTRRDLLERSANLLSDFNMRGVILNRSGENLSEDDYEYGAVPG
jgi:Mrp family chromosome partitioning ATPase